MIEREITTSTFIPRWARDADPETLALMEKFDEIGVGRPPDELLPTSSVEGQPMSTQPRCGDCRYWTPRADSIFGKCNGVPYACDRGALNGKAFTDGIDGSYAELMVREDFGCVLFVAKPSSELSAKMAVAPILARKSMNAAANRVRLNAAASKIVYEIFVDCAKG